MGAVPFLEDEFTFDSLKTVNPQPCSLTVFLCLLLIVNSEVEASQPLHDIAKIMLDTGMRPEEVFRTRAENIDFRQKSIFNPFGKTKAARRTMPMTDNVISLLRVRVNESSAKETPFVFPSPYDIQKPIGSVKNAHSAAVERAKTNQHLRLYDMRHTFATRAVASGADLPTLSALLGHTSILMTMR